MKRTPAVLLFIVIVTVSALAAEWWIAKITGKYELIVSLVILPVETEAPFKESETPCMARVTISYDDQSIAVVDSVAIYHPASDQESSCLDLHGVALLRQVEKHGGGGRMSLSQFIAAIETIEIKRR